MLENDTVDGPCVGGSSEEQREQQTVHCFDDGSHCEIVQSVLRCYRMPTGATVDPVPPCSFSGWIMKANSYTRLATISSRFMFSRR